MLVLLNKEEPTMLTAATSNSETFVVTKILWTNVENQSSWFENCAVGNETEKEAESFSKDKQPVGRRTKFR